MNYLKLLTPLNTLLPIIFLFAFTACGDSENDDETLSLDVTETVAAVRANTVTVSITGLSETGANTLTATLEGETPRTIAIESGAKEILTEFAFTVPANAKLSDSYSIAFELTDGAGRKVTAITSVGVDPLLAVVPSNLLWLLPYLIVRFDLKKKRWYFHHVQNHNY